MRGIMTSVITLWIGCTLRQGVKRLEGAALRLLIHAAAGVAHRQHDVVPCAESEVTARARFVEPDVFGRDDQSSALRHGVARVDRQVEQDLLEVNRVRLDIAQSVAESERQLDALAEETGEQSAHPID